MTHQEKIALAAQAVALAVAVLAYAYSIKAERAARKALEDAKRIWR